MNDHKGVSFKIFYRGSISISNESVIKSLVVRLFFFFSLSALSFPFSLHPSFLPFVPHSLSIFSFLPSFSQLKWDHNSQCSGVLKLVVYGTNTSKLTTNIKEQCMPKFLFLFYLSCLRSCYKVHQML